MENEKMYTTTDLMEITGLTRAGVLRRARPFGFTKYCKYVLKRTSWGNYKRRRGRRKDSARKARRNEKRTSAGY